MSAEELLDKLQQRGMVEDKVVAKLRKQLANSTKSISPARIVRLLVDRGYLTAHQALTLIEGESSISPPDEPAELISTDEDDILGIAPGFEKEIAPQAKPEPSTPPAPPVFELDEGDDEDDEVIDLVADIEDDVPPAPIKEPSFARPAAIESTPADVSKTADAADVVGDDELRSDTHARAALLRGKGWRAFVRRHRKTFRSKTWDSPLMLVGGGGLVLLLLAGVVMLMGLIRGSGDELFEQAEEDYRRGAYSQAISTYDQFLSRFPRHPKASWARVRSGLARLRQAVEGGTDWDRALASANDVLPRIKDEPAFEEARPELSSLLPDIYAGFVQQAEAAESLEDARRHVVSAEEARTLVDNSEYLPTSLREPQQARIESIGADVQTVLREIDRDARLQTTIQQIQESTGQGEVIQAYQSRQQLLALYPRLANDQELLEAVRAIGEKEQELVHEISVDQSPLGNDRELAVPLRVALADRKTEGQAEGLDGQVIFFLLRGAVYGLEATSGRLLWRRYVGHQTTIHPVALSQDVAADTIVVDQRHRELLRLQARSGKLVWRVPLPERTSAPLVLDNRILLSTESGKLLRIDSATGKPTDAVELPQPLDVTPGIDRRRGILYQVGSHSTLFALSAETLHCNHVFYLGHDRGTVAVAPVVTMGHVFVVENRGIDFSYLHVLAADDNGLARAGPPIRLTGQVVTPMVLSDRRVLLATDRREVRVFEVEPSGGPRSVREIARVEGTSKRPVNRYLLADRGRVWAADQRLTSYELNVARGELSSKWTIDEGDAVVAPLQRRGNFVFHARQARGVSGLTVSATRIALDRGSRQDGQRVWETDMAVPLAGQVMIDAATKRVVAVSSHGAVFDINADLLRQGVTDRPSERVRAGAQTLSFSHGVALSQGRFAYASDSDARGILVYDPRPTASRLRLVDLPIAKDDQGIPPVALGRALLFPRQDGPVALVDVDDPNQQNNVIHPFQPRLSPGRKIDWRRPAVVDQARQQFVIADSTGALYRVGVKNEPRPHLADLAHRELHAEVVSPLATLGKLGYVVLRKGEQHVLASFGLTDLDVAQQWPLEGRLVWGPERVADAVLVCTDTEGMICLEAGPEPRWTASVSHRALAGPPLFVDDCFVFASMEGTLWRVDASSGQPVGWGSADQFDVGEPLGAGPVAFGRRLLLVGRDGTLYVTGLPDREPNRPQAGP